MRMASYHFVGNAFGHVFKRKTAFFFGNACVKDNLQQKIAKLITNGVTVANLNGISHLISFFDSVGGDAGKILGDIPRTAGFWITKPDHNLIQPIKFIKMICHARQPIKVMMS